MENKRPQDMAKPAIEPVELNTADIKKLEKGASLEMSRRSILSSFSYFLVMFVLIFTTDYDKDHGVFIYSCLALFTVLVLSRILLAYFFETIYNAREKLWDITFTAVLILTAFTWGLISSLGVYFYDGDWTALLVTVATSAFCSGAIYSLGMRLAVISTYLALTLLPNIISSIIVEATGLAIFFIFYLIFCISQARLVNREYWDARINTLRLDSDVKDRLHQLTYLDTLTNLPNRDLFHDRLQQAIQNAKRRDYTVGVLFIGLDKFSSVNDTLGHKAGDELLKSMANRFSNALRENDTVARVSSDIFAVIINHIQQPRDTARIASKLLKAVNQPIVVSNLELFATASIGISIFENEEKTTIDSLIHDAESTMHKAKDMGGNDFQFFEHKSNTEAAKRFQLETKLRRALERDEYRLYYQPKVNLSTGELCGFEALIRWCPQGKDPVSPLDFIPILEETGLIVPVGEWVLRTACQQAKIWEDLYQRPMRMAVNLSARQFKEKNLAETVQNILNDVNLAPEHLELEITESMVMDYTEETTEILNNFKMMGIHLSIDDFGTGYSSLAYLKRMPIHSLKIDRSFVKDIAIDENDAAVVQAIIAMAHTLNLTVVAEGVETEEQLKFLKLQECDDVQGFLFSRPLPEAELRPMLENGRNLVEEHYNEVSNVVELSSKNDGSTS